MKMYKQLSELGDIVTGKTPSTTNNELWGGTIPFITPTDIEGYDTYYQESTERTVSAYGASRQQKTLLPPNTVCVTCIGSTIGKPCITKSASITNQQINTIIPNKDNDYRYIYYLIREALPYFQLIGGGSGSGTPIISKNKFAKLKFPIEPNLQKQRKIASILSAYDSLIENNTKRIHLLEQMAENLYKEWFVRFRFPGYENTEFVNGLPQCWSVKKYGEIAEIVAGGDCPCICSDIPTDDLCVPIYSNGATNEGLYGYTNKERISKPCITISARGTIGYVCLRTIPFVPIVRLLAVVPKNISVYYLFHYSRHNYLEGNGTSQQQLTKPMLQKRKVLVPAESTLLKFDMNVENIYNQKRKLEKINNTLTRQRDLLLPRLMSGKLEVKA